MWAEKIENFSNFNKKSNVSRDHMKNVTENEPNEMIFLLIIFIYDR